MELWLSLIVWNTLRQLEIVIWDGQSVSFQIGDIDPVVVVCSSLIIDRRHACLSFINAELRHEDVLQRPNIMEVQEDIFKACSICIFFCFYNLCKIFLLTPQCGVTKPGALNLSLNNPIFWSVMLCESLTGVTLLKRGVCYG